MIKKQLWFVINIQQQVKIPEFLGLTGYKNVK
jgi:hypothetical protein